MKQLLLMSSSRKGNLGYLEHADEQLNTILSDKIKRVLFIPYAGVSFSFDDYEKMVRPVYERLGYELVSVHQFDNAAEAVASADALAVGGGNTFALLTRLYENKLVELVHERVADGMPYMGWSAGTNVACPTIRTTNDMPIVQPPSFSAFNLVPFQINPHFISGKPVGHNGESREERLGEFLVMNPKESVVAIPEGTALYVQGDQARIMGEFDGMVFRQDKVETLASGGEFPLSQING
ncbi:dipeptidase PepE [Zobellella aerophila]|uniref:Dipeptidase PepE n=1 Tax=Zobellella aerophila TaxID=870480 RepID=A0ABP6WDB6_9GAMM